ncbi:MAG: FmdB family zinc ribbon protein [Rhodanobacteraceae bacterium]
MPIYVFRCDDCGEKFERLQKLSDPDPDTCPHCGRHVVRRQVTAPAFRLAGSGWYETDFKSGKEKKHNLAGDAGKPEPSGDKPVEAGKGGDAGKEISKPAAPEKPAKATEKPAKAPAGD